MVEVLAVGWCCFVETINPDKWTFIVTLDRKFNGELS